MTNPFNSKQKTICVNKADAKMFKSRHHKFLLASVAIVVLSNTAMAQDLTNCELNDCLNDGENNAQVAQLSVGANTELSEDNNISGLGDLGISVSVDGEQLVGDVQTVEDKQRAADVSLDKMDIQVKFDGLEVKPILNVSTVDLRRSYKAGETVNFLATMNYPSWIEKSEIRIYRKDKSQDLVDTISIAPNKSTSWIMPSDGGDEFEYVLRVYDSKGRFDETTSLTLNRSTKSFDQHKVTPAQKAVSAGNGEDRTALRNIPIYGGGVTVYGRNIPQGYRVQALGESLPVDNEQAFVVQRILPPGDHSVDVEVLGTEDGGVSITRDINIPANDWFYVGLADLTVGKRFGSDRLVDANGNEFDDIYTKGRLAFYLKGKIKGKYILTAAADTREERIQDLFKGLDSKDTRSLLRRIDPDKYYPVYGDDSTITEDAPTSGKFYIRLERGDSHVMWGNFKSSIRGAEFIRSERGLYGGSAVYRSQETTSFGDRKVEASAYVAQPGTLPQRDILRGTGGSTYFLKRQDISFGSETISIEIRDSVTGRIIERKQLTYGVDYRVDYIQGIVILTKPLNSTASDAGLVRDNALGDNVVNLIAQYEYTPTLTNVDGYSYGGRAQAWVGDKVRIGATGINEKTGTGVIDSNQELLGADVMLRHSEGTWIKGEYARSEGPGFGRSFSVDGGLTIDDSASAGVVNRVADAWSVKAQIDIADFSQTIKGRIGAYYEKKEAGFSTLDYNISVDQNIAGAYIEVEPSENLELALRYDHFDDANGKRSDEIEADAKFQLDDFWIVTIGAKYSDLVTPGGGAGTNGARTDLAAKVAYKPNEDGEFYAFGQGTVDRSGNRNKNHRGGVGVKFAVTEKVDLEGEVSYGTTGLGAFGGINYHPTANEHYYLGYRLDPERSVGGTTLDGVDFGGFVIGANRKYDDQWSVFSENNIDLYGKRRSLTSTYGVTYTPDAQWTFDGGFEVGHILDPNAPNFERQAISLGVSYKDEDKLLANLRGELRFDDSEDNTRDVSSYLISGGLSYKTNPDWRFIASADAVFSQSNQTSFRNGDYVEGSIGFAYRPVENDRLNALFKYTLLYDLPGVDQTVVSGARNGTRQRSHVLSADATWQINNYLTIGGKYGFRIGDVETGSGTGVYTRESAHLAVARADIHVLHNWDVFIEGRVLNSPSAQTIDFGALAGIYRHIGANAKIGIGYNFGKFSDDLTDLSHDDQGVFLNVIAKF